MQAVRDLVYKEWHNNAQELVHEYWEKKLCFLIYIPVGATVTLSGEGGFVDVVSVLLFCCNTENTKWSGW